MPRVSLPRFHSISFPSEWELELRTTPACATFRFHSISFPSEWEPVGLPGEYPGGFMVSIQLVSPASGNPSILNPYPVRGLEAVGEGV